jgi:hypothetical protein
LCYFGKGGFTWDEVYNLPIYLRHYYIKLVKKKLDEENNAVNSETHKTPASPPKFSKPSSRK